MRGSKHPFRVRTLGLPEQKARLRQFWPDLRCTTSGATLTCTGAVSPLPIAPSYRVRLVYRIKTWPRVYVEDPQLRRREGEPEVPIPHTFGKEGEERPCLFYPDRTEWQSDMALANTILPWTYEWLADYELWHATGEWYGGGIEHTPGTKK